MKIFKIIFSTDRKIIIQKYLFAILSFAHNNFDYGKHFTFLERPISCKKYQHYLYLHALKRVFGKLDKFNLFVLKKMIWYLFCRGGGIGRRTGLKIQWEFIPVPVRVRPSVLK